MIEFEFAHSWAAIDDSNGKTRPARICFAPTKIIGVQEMTPITCNLIIAGSTIVFTVKGSFDEILNRIEDAIDLEKELEASAAALQIVGES